MPSQDIPPRKPSSEGSLADDTKTTTDVLEVNEKYPDTQIPEGKPLRKASAEDIPSSGGSLSDEIKKQTDVPQVNEESSGTKPPEDTPPRKDSAEDTSSSGGPLSDNTEKPIEISENPSNVQQPDTNSDSNEPYNDVNIIKLD